MGLYDTFETDADLEVKGIWINYGDFAVKIAAAGMKNKKYEKVAEQKFKPVRKMMELGALSNERSMQILAEIYAEAIVLDWQTGDEKGKIEAPDGTLIPFTKENCEKTLKALPRLLIDIQEQANSLSNFKRAEEEKEKGNSKRS